MARYLPKLAKSEAQRLRAVCRTLRRTKPEGWSVVWRANEISVRPKARAVGRFSVVYLERLGFQLSFFCQEAGIWNKYRKFSDSPTLEDEIVRWMVHAADNPNTEEKDERTV